MIVYSTVRPAACYESEGVEWRSPKGTSPAFCRSFIDGQWVDDENFNATTGEHDDGERLQVSERTGPSTQGAGDDGQSTTSTGEDGTEEEPEEVADGRPEGEGVDDDTPPVV